MRPNKPRELDYVEFVGEYGPFDLHDLEVDQEPRGFLAPPRAEIATADQAKYFLDMGVRHFSVGTDITVLHQWWKSQGEDLRKALGGG